MDELKAELEQLRRKVKPLLKEFHAEWRARFDLMTNYIHRFITLDAAGKIECREFNLAFIRYCWKNYQVIVSHLQIPDCLATYLQVPIDDVITTGVDNIKYYVGISWAPI